MSHLSVLAGAVGRPADRPVWGSQAAEGRPAVEGSQAAVQGTLVVEGRPAVEGTLVLALRGTAERGRWAQLGHSGLGCDDV